MNKRLFAYREKTIPADPCSSKLSDRQTVAAFPIGFVDRGNSVAELAKVAKVAKFGVSSAPMANLWQYMPLGVA